MNPFHNKLHVVGLEKTTCLGCFFKLGMIILDCYPCQQGCEVSLRFDHLKTEKKKRRMILEDGFEKNLEDGFEEEGVLEEGLERFSLV